MFSTIQGIYIWEGNIYIYINLVFSAFYIKNLLQFLNAMIDELSDKLSITMVGTNSVFIWPNDEYNNFYNVFSFGYKKIQSLFGSK